MISSEKNSVSIQTAETVADVKLLKEAAEYLVLKQIPMMIQDFQDHSSVPVDGETLSEAMHSR